MIDKIYAKLPIFLQNVACTLYGIKERRLRFGKTFRVFLNEYQGNEYLPQTRLLEMEANKLRGILQHAQQHVPFYQQRMAELGVNTNAQDIRAELTKLPVMTKELLREHLDDLLADNVPASERIELHTSGTTGKALTLYRDKVSLAEQWALCYRHRGWYDCQFGDLHVNFTGKLVVPVAQTKPPFWRFNQAFNQYFVNMQHINDTNIASIVAFLNSITPKFYSGYPSILAELARLAMAHGLTLQDDARPRVIFAGAENTLDYQKEAIEQWTGAPVTDLYGLTEANCHMSRCEKGYYHVDHEYGFIEAGNPEMLEGGKVRGALIATGFSSKSMPFIRYDTGDVAVWMPQGYRCECGRSGTIIERIDGRIDDVVLLNDGRQMMRFDYLFKGTDDIKEAQVCQDVPGEVIFKLVLRSDDRDTIEREIRQQFEKWIAKDMRLTFEYVDAIPRSNTGKFKAVVSNLKN